MTEKNKTRERSPTYPVIGLKEAIDKVREIYNKEGRNSVARDIAITSMGYNSPSGRSLQVLSALLQYKLLTRSTGKVRVSDEAFTILHAPENNPDRENALKSVALAPSIFKEIKDEYPNSLPSDENLRWFLQRRKLSTKAANITISSFKETNSFANVYESDYDIDDEQLDVNEDSKDSSMNTNIQLAPNTGIKAEKWAFPFGEKTISLLIEGGKPDQDEMQSLIDILNAVKNTLPKKKKEENN